ncbi:MAG: DUF1294 domain-containing protein [Lachnospiraceae bacterium]|nr:DUF1294 domain-containing protein [Lachnospiraceae bacterium]
MIFWCYIFAINLIAFALYGIDKKNAVKKQWRIPEATLIGVAAMGGGIGAILGMFFWHHKTRKWKFRIMVPLCVILWIIGLILVLQYFMSIG